MAGGIGSTSADDYLKLVRPVARFDVGDMFADAGKGMALAKDIDERRTLADIGLAYKNGGLNAAKDTAFGAGMIDQGTKLGEHGINLSKEDRARVTDTMKQLSEMGVAASSLSGPQYESYLDTLAGKGMQVPAQFRGEQGRQMLIAQSKTTLDQIRAELAQKQASAADSAASAAKKNAELPFVADQAQASIGLQRAQAESLRTNAETNSQNVRNQSPEARASQAELYGLKPGTREYQTYTLTGQLPTKQSGPDDKFTEAAATKQADRFNDDVVQASAANKSISDIGVMRGLSDKLGEPGVANSVTRTFGPALRAIGLAPERLSDQEAFVALTSKLVPQQRPPGSGTMSDKDVELFKQSLPQLAATAQGRRMILDQIEAISRYDQARGLIASKALNGELSRADAERLLRDIPDPMQLFRQNGGGGGPVRVTSPDEALRLPPGTQFVTPDGQTRIKR
jgi:hypothetical protein